MDITCKLHFLRKIKETDYKVLKAKDGKKAGGQVVREARL